MEKICHANGLSHWGWIPLQQSFSIQHYRNWLEKGWQGEMNYLQEHLAAKENPQSRYPDIYSALVVTQPYAPHPEPMSIFPGLRIAQYAQGQDYHFWFKQKLQKIAEQLKALYPTEEFLSFTDSAPVLERDLAYQAGLGWVGKNTCLIDKQEGSFFFIGEIYSSLLISTPASIELSPDHCGTCQRCIDACPTQAIESPRQLNATKCISYWTIESRQLPPEEIRSKLGDHFFGCDICQTICPWNEKAFRFKSNIKQTWNNSLLRDLSPPEYSLAVQDLRFILTASGKQLSKKISGTALLRAGPFGLRRNALLVVGNQKLFELKTEVERWHDDEKLGSLANWTLKELQS